MEQKQVLERKVHAKPHPEKYRLSNNKKRTKGRIKMGTTIQSVPVKSETGYIIGYHHVFHQNNI